MLINLLENAAQVHAGRTPIEVDARATPTARCVVEVADRGPGLPAGRGASASSRSSTAAAAAHGQRGVGLGLAICRGIVDGARRAHLGREPGRRRRRVPLHAARRRTRRRSPSEQRCAEPGSATRPTAAPPAGRRPHRGRAADPPVPARLARRARATGCRGDAPARTGSIEAADAPARRRPPRPRPARHRRPGGDPAAARVEHGADHRALGARPGERQDRRARRRRRRLPHQALRVGELLARIRVALRHAAPAASRASPSSRVGDLQVDLVKRAGPASTARRSTSRRSSTGCSTTLVKHAGRVLTPAPAPEGGVGARPRRPDPLPPRLHGPAPPQARARSGPTAVPADRAGRRLPAGRRMIAATTDQKRSAP